MMSSPPRATAPPEDDSGIHLVTGLLHRRSGNPAHRIQAVVDLIAALGLEGKHSLQISQAETMRTELLCVFEHRRDADRFATAVRAEKNLRPRPGYASHAPAFDSP
jgi:hypothetical protein